MDPGFNLAANCSIFSRPPPTPTTRPPQSHFQHQIDPFASSPSRIQPPPQHSILPPHPPHPPPPTAGPGPGPGGTMANMAISSGPNLPQLVTYMNNRPQQQQQQQQQQDLTRNLQALQIEKK